MEVHTAMTRVSRGPHQQESTGWRVAILVPILFLALVGGFLTAKCLEPLGKELAAHGGNAVACRGGRLLSVIWRGRPQDMLCLQLAFTPDTAARVFGAWSIPTKSGASPAQALDGKIEVARQSIAIDWFFIVSYVVFLSACGLVLMWLLRYERRTFGPVLFVCPIIAGLLDCAENLAILEMLADPERPPALVAALGGTASMLKWLLLLAVIPIAIVWALAKLPRRARQPDQSVEDFPAVLAAESAYILKRRELAGLDEPPRTGVWLQPVGLSLSGGGIRSATFNLGVLQALSRLGVLPWVDYLSTVSGGGYIGSCLSSLLSRRRDALDSQNPRRFGPGEEPNFTMKPDRFPFNPNSGEQAALRAFNGRDQLRHLRTHGDFLIARRSLLSRDMLRAVGHALGSTFYHVLVAVLFLVAVAGLYLAVVEAMIGDLRTHVVGVLAPAQYARALFDAGPLGLRPFGWAFAFGLMSSAIGLLFGIATYRVPASWIDSEGQSEEESRGYLALWILFWLTFLTAAAVTWYWTSHYGPRLAFLCLPLGVYLGGQLMTLVLHPIIAMPSVFGRDVRSRFAGAQGLFTYFDAISLIVIIFPYVIEWLRLWQPPGGKTAMGWLLGVVGARLLASGSGQKSAGTAAGIIGRLRKLGPGLRHALLSALAVVLVVGGVLLLCVWMLEEQPPGDSHLVKFPLLIGLLATALFVLLGVFLDFNKLSLHYFYRDRLAETYLQTFAAAGGGLVEVKKRDDSEMPLTELHGRHRDEHHATDCVTPAPYHLVMSALNLTASRDMTRRDRKSDYFTFSRLYCGSETTGYMRTDKYRSAETKLARAMTISGAAASSAIGSQTFLAQSFALTLLGVRLGQWIENPRYRGGARANRREGGVFWPFYLLREMMGSTDAVRRLINVSDGGHTGDNIGICPLLKRRCRVVIACDAEADPHFAFGSLTEALRQIYVDENICVNLDLDAVQPDPVTRRSARHWAIGTIRYPRIVDAAGAEVRPEESGYLIVLKSSFVGGAEDSEPLKNYLREHPEFPQEGTGDQFFSDDQFESYRELGALVAAAAWKASRR
jgi:patatin-like phospholipase